MMRKIDLIKRIAQGLASKRMQGLAPARDVKSFNLSNSSQNNHLNEFGFPNNIAKKIENELKSTELVNYDTIFLLITYFINDLNEIDTIKTRLSALERLSERADLLHQKAPRLYTPEIRAVRLPSEFLEEIYGDMVASLHQGWLADHDPYLFSALCEEGNIATYLPTESEYQEITRGLFACAIGIAKDDPGLDRKLQSFSNLIAPPNAHRQVKPVLGKHTARVAGQDEKVPLRQAVDDQGEAVTWKTHKQPGDTPPDFIKRHYADHLLGANETHEILTRPALNKLDPSCYTALANWLRSNNLPEDCPMPTKSETLTLTPPAMLDSAPEPTADMKSYWRAASKRHYEKQKILN